MKPDDVTQHSILVMPEDVEALTSQAARDLQDDLRRGWHAKAVIAGVNQARLAKAFETAQPLHHEALGQLVGVVDPWVYEEMCRQFGRGCWRDPGFRRDFFKRNPEANIRSRSRKLSFRVDGLKDTAASADARTGGAIVCP